MRPSHHCRALPFRCERNGTSKKLESMCPAQGSHTLRHTCVQRLVDSGFSLKTIGDFVGHGTPDATKIYAKVNVQALREVALGDGEEVL
jgi:site-specific recombinase XerD